MKTYIWFALIPLIFLQFACNFSNLNSEPENNKSLYSSIDSLNPLPAFSAPRTGNIINLQTGTVISQNDLETGFEEIINKNNTGLKLLISKDEKISLIAAYGSDNKYHAVNSFLTGFSPNLLNTEPLILWKILTKRITYKRDNESTLARDLWFSSGETFNRKIGDCEDSSILLTDWLISLGYTARVVLGETDGMGHAWVILQDSKTKEWFLLESTSYPYFINALPLASLQTKYKPEFMFDKEFVWKNSQKQNPTNNYNDEQVWKKTLEFRTDEQSIRDFSSNYQKKNLSQKRNNFYTEVIIDGSISKWHKSNLNYYFDSATIKNTEVKKRFKRAFDLWQRKSQIFSFNEVFNEKQADIYISLSEEADIATINPDIIIPAGKVNDLKKQSIYHTKIIFPVKYFAFNFNKDFRNYKITQNLIIYSLGMTLGLKPHESEPDSNSCLYSWNLGNHEKRDCESLTSSINTLNIIYK